MYQYFAKFQGRRFYGKLNEHNYEWIVQRYADHMTLGHKHDGSDALGGTRHSPAAARRWFQRLFTLIPDLHVEIRDSVAKGWPWHVVLATEWTARGTCADGEPYYDEGVQIVHVKLGRIVGARWYHDTKRVAEACERMARNGIKEAAAPPIED
jgi:ketosteroid isomerase-like protein